MLEKCRVCSSRKLKDALTIEKIAYVICQTCTLLQKKENIDYAINIDFSSGGLSFDYYPFYLQRKLPFNSDNVVYFSLKAIESLLELQGYQVINAQTTDEGRIEVQFKPMNSVDKIRLFELSKKLWSQFTYFLYSVKK